MFAQAFAGLADAYAATLGFFLILAESAAEVMPKARASALRALNVYGNALMDSKRKANSKVVQMVLRPASKDATQKEASLSSASHLTLTDPRGGKLGIASS